MSVQKRRKDNKGRVLKTGESQRKDGSYQFRYTDVYDNRKIVYAPDLKALRMKEVEIQKALAAGVLFQCPNITVTELFENFLKLKHNIRRSTRQNYDNILSVLKRHPFGSVKIGRIRKADAKKFIISLSEEGRKTSTVNIYKSALKAAFDIACEDKIIAENPFAFPTQSVLKNDTQKKEALTEPQVDALLAFIHNDKRYSRYEAEVRILLGTGLRISELYSLTLNDLDFVNKRISVNHQIAWIRESGKSVPVIHPPKTDAGNRLIPMTAEVEAWLRKVLYDRELELPSPTIDGYTDFVFLQNAQLRRTANIDNAFRRMREAYNRSHSAEEQLPPLTPHILRHTFCTNMIYRGMNIKSVQYLMGHSSIGVTLSVYTHANQESVFADFAQATAPLPDNCVYVNFAG